MRATLTFFVYLGMIVEGLSFIVIVMAGAVIAMAMFGDYTYSEMPLYSKVFHSDIYGTEELAKENTVTVFIISILLFIGARVVRKSSERIIEENDRM